MASTITAVVMAGTPRLRGGPSAGAVKSAADPDGLRNRGTRDGAHDCARRSAGRQQPEDAAQLADVGVVERRGEVGLHGAPVGDVHLPPQRAGPGGSARRRRRGGRPAGRSRAGHPAVLLQPVEAAAEARAHEPQLVGELAGAGRTAAGAAARRARRTSRAGRPTRPTSASSTVRSSSAGDRLQLAPHGDAASASSRAIDRLRPSPSRAAPNAPSARSISAADDDQRRHPAQRPRRRCRRSSGSRGPRAGSGLLMAATRAGVGELGADHQARARAPARTPASSALQLAGRPARSCSPRARTSSRKPGAVSTSIVASAAAQPIGLPP